jgi:neuromedin U receptor 1
MTNTSYDEGDNKTLFRANVVMPPNRDPLYVVIPITVIYALIFVAGVVGNIITCIVIRRNKHMHTTTNLYLFR